jgi:hypothetical protein
MCAQVSGRGDNAQTEGVVLIMTTTVGGDTGGKLKRECRVVFRYEGKIIATSRVYLSANTEPKIESYALSEQRKAGVSIPKGTQMETQWL